MPRRRRLGEVLLARGQLDRSGLERALAAQQVLGGTLGTALLELGLVDEDRLLDALAGVTERPAASADALRSAQPAATSLVPAKLALRHRAVPIRAFGAQLDVALFDAGNLAALDELSFASGRRINPHVALDARLCEALERHYGGECPQRIARLVDRLNRARFLWRDEAEKAAEADGGPLGGPGGRWSTALAESPLLPDIDLPGEPPRRAPPPVPQAPTAPQAEAGANGRPERRAKRRPERRTPTALPLADAEALLEIAVDRDQIGAAAVAGMLSLLPRAAVLAVRANRVTGWLGGGEGFEPDRLLRLVIPLNQPSIFLNLVQGSSLHLGQLPSWPVHRRLARCWGSDLPGEGLAVPMSVGSRLVAVLYGDRAGESLGAVDLAAIKRLADRAAAALERCIMLKRQGETSLPRH